MHWKNWLAALLVVGVLTPGIAMANSKETTYVIKKGDTLWGISNRFIKDPYYWPNLWSNNPFITNPHLIYPGQRIAIIDGRIQIVAEGADSDTAAPAATAIATAEGTELPEVVQETTFRTYDGAEGYIDLGTLPALGSLVDTVDNRLLMTRGDTVFVQLENLHDYRPGDALAIYRIGQDVFHPITKKLFGHRIAQVGVLVLTEINEQVATATITDAIQEILRTDKLLPYAPPTREISLKEAKAQAQGYLVDAVGGQIGLGQQDIVYLDIGTEAGVEVGNMVNITRQRKPSEFIVDQTDLKLPDVLLGSAVIIETRARTSTALVIKSAEALYRGDQVSTIMAER